MSNPITKIFDAATGETIEREMTDVEYADLKIRIADIQKEKVAEAQTAIAKAALLERLGITADEAKLLLA
jgi:hypothetical protein